MIAAELVAAAATTAAALVLTSGDKADGRLARVVPAPGAAKPAAGTRASRAGAPALIGMRRRLAAVTLAGVGLAATVGGVGGVLLGAVAAGCGYLVLGRLEPRATRLRREQVARDLPAAASLLSAAVAAGATPVAAVEVVAVAVGGPLGEDLQCIAASARLGGDFAAGHGASIPGSHATPLVRVIARSVQTGAPLAAALHRLAVDLHAERRFEIDRRARSVGVRAAAPLGLCFLPAFLLVGVVPVVAGIASKVLGFAL